MNFKLNGTWYQAEQSSTSSADVPAFAEKLEAREEEAANLCHYKIPPSNLSEQNGGGVNLRASMSAFVLAKGALNVASFQGEAVEKQLELAVVIDESFTRNTGGGESGAIDRVLQVVNFVNGLYQPLRLRVLLTDVVVWNRNQILVNSDPSGTLNRFSEFKALRLGIRHDTVILLSTQTWNGGRTLGLAWMGAACNKLISSGIVADRYPEAISTALIMAHEIGHILGFQHMQDVIGCACSRSPTGCIMNSNLAPETRTEALGWSSCSVRTWNAQVGETWRSCLSDAPEVAYSSNGSSVCGNGIVESDEQCDCGPAETCSSNCCDAKTCRLKSGATCASGPCCNWTTCGWRPRGQICRAANGPCDVPETCSGSGEWCPSDDKVRDGVDCSAGQAFCYKGQCRTRDAQCQRLFSNAAKSADSRCFTTLNVRKDSPYGHCHMKLKNLLFKSNSATSTEIYSAFSYQACALEHAECGLQHCYQDRRPSVGDTVTVGSVVCHFLPNIDLSSSGTRSPSLVPDGAKCGTDSMCINSTCTPLNTVRACNLCPDCNDNGVLTTSDVCFCRAGFHPPNCSAPGCGGSVTSPLACAGDSIPAPQSTMTTQSATSMPTSPLSAVNDSAVVTVSTPRFHTRTTVSKIKAGSNRLSADRRLVIAGALKLVLFILARSQF